MIARRLLGLVALAVPLIANAADLPTLPNPSLTPGDVASTDAGEVCQMGYARAHRNVSLDLKIQIEHEYGIYDWHPGLLEVDHLVPLELGGSNDQKNLWAEPWAEPWGAGTKDKLENELHFRVCVAHSMTLAEAQREIARDWIALYKRVFPQS